jgi:hypothetical protein
MKPVPLLVSLALLVLPLGPTAAAPPRISDADAHRHVGREVTVCGHVASATHLASVRGGPTFLNFGKPYPNHTFTIVIWDDARGRFSDPPESLYEDADICVTGKVALYKGKPQIVVRSPTQIEASAPRFVADRYTEEERIVLKAMLAALGYEVDRGSAAWDDDARRALAAFQAAEGIVPEGDRSAPTLRRLAERVDRIPDAEKTAILRLLLLNMAQREER